MVGSTLLRFTEGKLSPETSVPGSQRQSPTKVPNQSRFRMTETLLVGPGRGKVKELLSRRCTLQVPIGAELWS